MTRLLLHKTLKRSCVAEREPHVAIDIRIMFDMAAQPIGSEM
ncbi:hypothetical protein X740_17285 [Mesorhizobium sp. LNHC221B00]|nr:hypothetical protein X768_17200 [Mesorhizobium sp. LSJC265A00]ESY79587.1 hypothetical protein X740_17285 [Mesorhizobium sp. LNHC221B00]ESZ56285.1 hypothetical protein X728_25745 [Mesorhizobium sp. L103C120A0]